MIRSEQGIMDVHDRFSFRRITWPTFSLAILVAVMAMGVQGRLLAKEPFAAGLPEFGAIGPPPPDEVIRLNLDPFYKKYVAVETFPIIASGKVSDYALLEAAHIVGSMLGERSDILHALSEQGIRLSIMSVDERTTDIPEHADLRPEAYWNRRARGLGSTLARPAVSCGEENLLGYPGDPYATENILVHEFAHTIQLQGLKAVDSTFNQRLERAYETALAQGKWKDTYAAQNEQEYWAEGVQSWFDTNRSNDHDHNGIDSREELKQYDPTLSALLTEVFGDQEWKYVHPSLRKEAAHLDGYDALRVPTFSWSKQEQEAYNDHTEADAPRQETSPPPERPNILFIAIDDLRPELGCYGVQEIKTPNMDRLASQGVVFDRAYCQQAVCNPSRASLLTGLRPDSTKVWDLVTDFRDTIPDVVTLPQHFKQNGYYAVGMGKIYHNTFPDPKSWSVPKPKPKGYQTYSKEVRSQLDQKRKEAREAGMTEREIGNRIRGPATDIEDVPDHQRFDGALGNLALEQLREAHSQDAPFFLAVGFIRPHLPWTPPKKYWDLYDPMEIPLAANDFLPHNAPPVSYGDRSLGGMYELMDCMDFKEAPSPFEGTLTEAQQRRLKHGYYASVSFVDTQVGRLMDELDRLGLRDNTIVVLWGDHGWKLGEHNGWCKQTNYEIDTRSPLIIAAPGAKANGKHSKSLVEFVDIYPTLCKLAKLPLPEHLEGTSIAPLLDNPNRMVKQAAFSQFPRRHDGAKYMGYAMRTDRYRYVEWLNSETGETSDVEVYDEEEDPEENNNIALRPENAQLLGQLQNQLWKGFARPEVNAKQKTAKQKQRPNILFLMGDDWSWPHAGILGDPVVKTPTFDRIAREGVLFENAFVSAPSCTPSRMAIATGQWHWRLGEAVNLGGSLAKDVNVYPEMLQDVGYTIGYARKGAAPSKHLYRGSDPFGPRFDSFQKFFAKRKADEPFCFWYGSGEPHRPYTWQSGVESGMKLDDVNVPACLPDNETTRTDLGDYYFDVQRFDKDAAGMIALLEKNGELENTIVVMSGDNGLPFPRCKATLYDTGTRVPLAIRWGAKIKGGRSIKDFVSLCDLAPTFLEAAGIEAAPAMTGRPLTAILASKKSGQIEPERFYALTAMERHVFPYPSRAIRTTGYLYIRNFEPETWPTGYGDGPLPTYDFTTRHWPSGAEAFSFNVDPSPSKQFMLQNPEDPLVAPLNVLAFGPRPEEELYDLRNDPDQLNNVADQPQYRRTRQELHSLLYSKLIASQDPRLAAPGHRVESIEGWTVFVNERLLEKEKEVTEQALGLLTKQLKTIVKLVPARAVAHFRTVPLWLSPLYEGKGPTAEYHPAVGWLRENGRDPAMAKCVEFTNISIFEKEYKRMPFFVLHELAHAYHNQVLGFDDAVIKAVYQRAVESGKYDAVKNQAGKTMRAYAMTDHKEYFAENTEAFFGQNDFQPFNKDELKTHDPEMYALLDQIWN